MLKLPFLTTPPFNPPTLSQLVSELFSSCFLCMLSYPWFNQVGLGFI
jgi:hypothetical protein